MNGTSIISIGDFNAHRSVKKNEVDFARYADILSFSELIHEATALKSELENSPFDQDLATRSQIIFAQFVKRIQLESPDLAATLKLAELASF